MHVKLEHPRSACQARALSKCMSLPITDITIYNLLHLHRTSTYQDRLVYGWRSVIGKCELIGNSHRYVAHHTYTAPLPSPACQLPINHSIPLPRLYQNLVRSIRPPIFAIAESSLSKCKSMIRRFLASSFALHGFKKGSRMGGRS